MTGSFGSCCGQECPRSGGGAEMRPRREGGAADDGRKAGPIADYHVKELAMNARLNMVYWKSKKFWLGKLVEHPEIMTHSRTLSELEGNIKHAYRRSVWAEPAPNHPLKKVH